MQSSTPLIARLDESANICDLLLDRVHSSPQAPLFALKKSSALRQEDAEPYTYVLAEEFLTRVQAVAKGLIAAGVRPGQSVAVMSSTRYEWTLADFAILWAGAVTVPIYETSSPLQAGWILEDSGAKFVFVGSEAIKDVILHSATEQSLPTPTIFSFDDGDLERLEESGAEVSNEELEKARTNRNLSDVATLVYTSGTLGRPKGCEITHGNFGVIALNASEFLPELLKTSHARTIMFLPLAHVLARCVQLVCVQRGITLLHSTNPAELVQDMSDFTPTFLLAVPRIFEKIFNRAQAQASSPVASKVFETAVRTAVSYSSTERPGPLLKARHSLFDALVYRKIRAVFGGKVKYTVSGASPLAPRLAHFYRGAGIVVLEGYGLTESSAPLTVNQVGRVRIGTVGKPLPGTSLKISDDGEILAQGVGVFRAYRNNEDATRAAFVDGWFRTGDLGSIDEDGYLSITGRTKELIVTAGGKNVAPTPLEERLRESPLIDQAVIIGDNRPFISALIGLDPEAVAQWAASTGTKETPLNEALEDPRLRQEIQQQVDYANELVSRAESIRHFILTDEPFDEANGRMTPSMKLKRSVVMKDFSEQIEAAYEQPQGRSGT